MQPITDVFYSNPKTVHPKSVESKSTNSARFSQHSNAIIASSKAPQPAVPSDCSIIFADTEDNIRSRTPQPSVPKPDPRLPGHMQFASPGRRDTLTGTTITDASPNARQPRIPLPTSICNQLADTWAMPPAVGRDTRRKTAWLKARAQYARDRELQRCSIPKHREVLQEPDHQPQRTNSNDFGPKRKQSAFVKEEELSCLLEDRVGTPHISELQPEDDVNAHLNVEQLGTGDVAELLAVGK